jgi:hypothetical protein
MRYKIEGVSPQIHAPVVLLTDTARDALTKRDAMSVLCGPEGKVTVYDTGLVANESALKTHAEQEDEKPGGQGR